MRRWGAEGMFGLAGGTISNESQRNLDKGQEWMNKKKPEKAIPFLLKAMEDPNNLDACVSLALAMPHDMAIELLKRGEQQGRDSLKRSLGEDCFEDNARYGAPNFWGILETRPYMRLLGTMTRMYVQLENWNKAIEVSLEVLRICSLDNMGQRYWVGSLLLQAGRPADALYLTQQWINSTDGTPPGSGTDFKEPSSAPLTKKIEWADDEMVYPAALAAFTLWGDCELARQYLHAAVEANPQVLIKVLANSKRPSDLKATPSRTLNGRETAHDHLWLTQDLWAKPEVMNWVDGDAFVKQHVLRVCSEPGCGKVEETVKQWQQCSACQKDHWSAHKVISRWNCLFRQVMGCQDLETAGVGVCGVSINSYLFSQLNSFVSDA
ncbi:hypothetical protein EV421DRAFT_1808973 [Armillaria borealis]|uniref:Uncharacterized protein n=1 Tax=Armillaria borealis TaxID=47425 RepID=A0AA39MPL1_9AGAR|nr:hypothetical protein EV421DRAFT_1808973 [Armillaria borealis]